MKANKIDLHDALRLFVAAHLTLEEAYKAGGRPDMAAGVRDFLSCSLDALDLFICVGCGQVVDESERDRAANERDCCKGCGDESESYAASRQQDWAWWQRKRG